MPQTSLDLEKITIRLHRGDKAKLDQLLPELGHNKVIRRLVRNFIKRSEANANRNERTTADDTITL